MQVLPDAVIINISGSQRKLLRDPRHGTSVVGISIGEKSARPRIQVSEIPSVIKRLQALKAAVVGDPAYVDQHPGEVIDQIILKIEDAAAAQRRAYPDAGKSN